MLAALFAALLIAAPLSVKAENPAKPMPADTSLLMSKEQALSMAHRALGIGRPDLALEIATQILQQNPNNGAADLVRAAAQSRLGNAKLAEQSGRRAYRLVSTPDGKFEAAFLTASAMAAQQKLTRAKLWLRNAHNHIQTDDDARLLRRAFTNLDKRTPTKLSFQLNAGRTNNANGGSLHDTFWLDGVIPIPISQALPGFVAQGQAKLSFRLSQSQRHELTVFAAASTKVVWLDAKAKALDPTAEASDFNSVGVDIGLSYRQSLSDTLMFAVNAQIGHEWLAAGSNVNRQRLKFSADKATGSGQMLSLAVTLAAAQKPDAGKSNSVSVAMEAGYSLPVGDGALSARLGYTAVMADARGVAWRGPMAGAEWQVPPVVKKVDVSLFGSVQVKDFWKTASDPDLSVEIGGSARLKTLTVMGFAPTISLTTSRSMSDVVVRDTADTSLSLGISSVF